MGVSGVGQQRKSEIYSLRPLRDPEMAKFTSITSETLGMEPSNRSFNIPTRVFDVGSSLRTTGYEIQIPF